MNFDNLADEFYAQSGASEAEWPTDDLDGSQPLDELDGLALTPTDDGNARALVEAHGRNLRYVSGLGWHEWDGTRWTPDREERVRELAKAVFRGFPTDSKTAFTHSRYSLSAVGTSNALRQAQSDHRVRIAPDHLDADPYLLNTPAGIVDLRTGTMQEHDPRLLQSKVTQVSPDRDLPTPIFDRFLRETFRDDDAVIDYVRVLLGYALIGDVREHVLPIATGPGGNGKGVLFDTVTAIIGDVDTGGYGLHANEGLLSTTSSHPTELARLFGARLVIAAEQDGKRPFAEARVKRLTGGDPIPARRMRMDFFTFIPSHTIIVVGNELPPVETGGPSFWRRVRVVPFLNTPANPDPNLKSKLWTESPGILAWMISGAVDYLRANRLPEPGAVMQASRDYQQSEDPLNVWFGEHLAVDEDGGPVPTKLIYERYKTWCRDNGHEPQGQRTITFRLQSEFGLRSGRPTVGGKRESCLSPLTWTATFAGDPW